MRSTTQISRSDEAEVAGYAAEGAIRAVEVAPLLLIGLLVCPPLAILAVVVVVPLLVIALVVGLLAAVITAPVVIVNYLRGHRGHVTLLVHRMRHACRAIVDLAPHRIAADARRLHATR
jgi:predicted membrane metal-binding protein